MKFLFLLALLASAAHAETITLAPANCGATRNCLSVPNDAAVTLQVNAQIYGTSVYVVLDGVTYRSPSGNAPTIADLILTDDAGEMVTLSAVFSARTTCTRSGRGQHCTTYWSLIDGSVVR